MDLKGRGQSCTKYNHHLISRTSGEDVNGKEERKGGRIDVKGDDIG